jgi:predicted DCC family thiol-disulfide oxidoreductase YuxK
MSNNWLLYDGDCPFCSAYVKLVRLRETVGPIALLDARQYPDRVAEISAQGYAIDKGMVLKLDERYYFGAQCMTALSALTTQSTVFNRVNRVLFRSPMLARVLYPVLRTGRNATLAVLGRRRVREEEVAELRAGDS